MPNETKNKFTSNVSVPHESTSEQAFGSKSRTKFANDWFREPHRNLIVPLVKRGESLEARIKVYDPWRTEQRAFKHKQLLCTDKLNWCFTDDLLAELSLFSFVTRKRIIGKTKISSFEGFLIFNITTTRKIAGTKFKLQDIRDQNRKTKSRLWKPENTLLCFELLSETADIYLYADKINYGKCINSTVLAKLANTKTLVATVQHNCYHGPIIANAFQSTVRAFSPCILSNIALFKARNLS